MEASQRSSTFRASWQLLKGALRTLATHKRLILLPLGSYGVIGLICVVGWLALLPVLPHSQALGAWMYAFFIIWLLALVGLIVTAKTMFEAAAIYTVLQAYHGQRLKMHLSVGRAVGKFWPIAAFSTMMGTIGIIFKILEDRLPVIGEVLAQAADTSWNIANYFSVPIIVSSEASVLPFTATKQSMHVLTQCWGKSLVTNLGIGVLSFLVCVIYIVAAFCGIVAIGHVYAGITGILIVIAAVVFLAIILYSGLLASIVKAALYYYATTNQSPESFNKAVIQAAMTRKKAQKAFL